MKVKELRQLCEDAEDDAEVIIVGGTGYSIWEYKVERGAVVVRREKDDDGDEIEPQHRGVFLALREGQQDGSAGRDVRREFEIV